VEDCQGGEELCHCVGDVAIVEIDGKAYSKSNPINWSHLMFPSPRKK
jgi:hypothetical protein